MKNIEERIADMRAGKPYWRILKFGETARSGDEWYYPFALFGDNWRLRSHFKQKITHDSWTHRRLVTPVKGSP